MGVVEVAEVSHLEHDLNCASLCFQWCPSPIEEARPPSLSYHFLFTTTLTDNNAGQSLLFMPQESSHFPGPSRVATKLDYIDRALTVNAGGDFGPIAPLRDAEEGSAARPGRKLALMSAADAAKYLKGTVSGLDQDLLASHLTRTRLPLYDAYAPEWFCIEEELSHALKEDMIFRSQVQKFCSSRRPSGRSHCIALQCNAALIALQ